MSFLNGLGTLATGLGAFTANSAADQQNRPDPAPTAPSASVPAAPPAAPEATPAAPAAATATTAQARAAAAATVPPALLPIYESASKRTGIPLDVLVAQAKQESGFRTDAVGRAGEIGLHQIKPSTAAKPGFGMSGIDPTTLKDPNVNINFAADYLRARAGPGVDFSNPRAVDAALAHFNGGGDPNYIANVRRHMGGA